MAGERDKLVADLKKLGEPEVRERLIKGNYGTNHSGNPTYSVVKAWLDSKDDGRKAEADLRAEQREEETLSIAREANSLSRKALSNSRLANTVAIIAMILSAATAIILAVIQSKP